MKGFAALRIFNGAGSIVRDVIMTEQSLCIGREPAVKGGAVEEGVENGTQKVLVPAECRGVSKMQHLKFYWDKSGGSPGFVMEVIGRCNGACVHGIQYKEGDKVRLSDTSVSAVSVGLSCYIFFAPAIRDVKHSHLTPHPSIDAMEVDTPKNEKYSMVVEKVEKSSNLVNSDNQGGSTRRFPKLWSKCIMEVFNSLCVTVMSQTYLQAQFIEMHRAACTSYFLTNAETAAPTGTSLTDESVQKELWVNLKRFVTKPPFSFDATTGLVRFDPSLVKTRTATQPVGSKRVKLGAVEEPEPVQDPLVNTNPSPSVVGPSVE